MITNEVSDMDSMVTIEIDSLELENWFRDVIGDHETGHEELYDRMEISGEVDIEFDNIVEPAEPSVGYKGESRWEDAELVYDGKRYPITYDNASAEVQEILNEALI